MKVFVIGCGHCGGRIADEFIRMGRRARSERGLEIVIDALAINTAISDLNGLTEVKVDPAHRILIGTKKAAGRGVGKINELGAEIARDETDAFIEIVKSNSRLISADVLIIIAGAGGGTGSGAIPVLTHALKEEFPEKPVYDMLALPFNHEEAAEQRVVYNSATCLKSSYLVADAVFLVDNQRYLRKDAGLQFNLDKINKMVVEPFYNLLCAGEEGKPKYIGSKVLDAGDIIQTLSGWSAIGHGHSRPPSLLGFVTGERQHFRKTAASMEKGVHAMNEALIDLSVKCDASDAKRALYLVTAAPDDIHVEVIKELGVLLRKAAKDASIRTGDYPRGRHAVDVTVILSELAAVDRINSIFEKAIKYLIAQKRRKGLKSELKSAEDAFSEIPLLF